MYTVEIAWFCFDLPDHSTVEAVTSAPNPLFPDTHVTTLWKADLGRFELTAQLSGSMGLSDLSREAADRNESGLEVVAFNNNGVPGLRYGDYDRERTSIDWWFSLYGLTLALRLTASGFPRTLPNEAERLEHEAIIDSVRRLQVGG